MDIFNGIDLKGNQVSNAVISTTFDSTAVAGAIKYVSGSPGKLQYYNGSSWIDIGSSSTINNNVNGKFKLKKGSHALGNTWEVTVATDVSTASLVEIDYDSTKGELTFSDNGSSSNYVSVSLTKPSDVIAACIATGSFTIDNTMNSSPYSVLVTHSLGSQYIQASVYKEAVIDARTEYRKIICETSAISDTQVRFTLNVGTDSLAYGTYHFILIGSNLSTTISSGNVTVTGTQI